MTLRAQSIRRIQVKDTVKEVEDYLKAYSLAEWIQLRCIGNTLRFQRAVRGDNTLTVLPFEELTFSVMSGKTNQVFMAG